MTDNEQLTEKAWLKIHSLSHKLEMMNNERDIAEKVQTKYAWDMILLYAVRELEDTKAILAQVLETYEAA